MEDGSVRLNSASTCLAEQGLVDMLPVSNDIDTCTLISGQVATCGARAFKHGSTFVTQSQPSSAATWHGYH